MKTVSIIATVLNEADNITRLLDSLKIQTHAPDEIIIVDGGSTDATLDILHQYQAELPLIVLSRPGCNISEGRNTAISAAQGDIIMATDAGLYLSPCWVECLKTPFLYDEKVQLVGGFFAADVHSLFEAAMGACVSRLPDEIDPKTFLPGSRSIAYSKSLWAQCGGYPEWLDFGEDMVFILNARGLASGLVFAPDAVVYFRPRASLRAFFKQYYHYARGDGKADLWRMRHGIRYVTYCGVIPTIFMLGLTLHWLFWSLYLIGGVIYLRQPYRRLQRVLPDAPRLRYVQALMLLPIIRMTGDVAKMLGYPAGIWWRWKHQRML